MTEEELDKLGEMEFPELEKLLRCAVGVRKIEPFERKEKQEAWQVKRDNLIIANHMRNTILRRTNGRQTWIGNYKFTS